MSKGERRGRWRRRLLLPLLLLAIGCVLGAAWFIGYPSYREWQAERAVRLAKSFLEKGDTRSGMLTVQTALRHRPGHIKAHEVAASLLEASGSAEALLYRRRLIELQPELLQPKMDFARSALRLNDPGAAEKAVEAVKAADRQASAFLEVQADLDLVRGRVDKAAANYRELLARNPQEKDLRVKLAILELQNGSQEERATARETLGSLTFEAESGSMALRALTRDALDRRDFPAALAWSEKLNELPSATFSDRLLRLQALSSAKSPDYELWLAHLERDASANPRFAFELGQWEVMALGPQRAVVWLESLPKNVKEVPLISVLVADCYSALQRWHDLESLVRWTNWRGLEALRLAFLARAQARQNDLHQSERTWELALGAAEKQPSQLLPLLGIARSDQRDVRQVLWLIAEKDPSKTWARKELYESYASEGNSEQMLRMMELVLRENPKDAAAKYNVAGLLMVVGRDIQRAESLARELYEADSASLAKSVLYAYALKLKGEGDKGAQILDARNDLDRLGNDGNAYYALILAACGRSDEARRFAAAVNRQELLPELRATLDQVF